MPASGMVGPKLARRCGGASGDSPCCRRLVHLAAIRLSKPDTEPAPLAALVKSGDVCRRRWRYCPPSGHPACPRHDDIELGRLPGEIERSNVSQQPGVGMEIGIGDRKTGIKRQLALRVDVAGDQEIQSDRRIRVGAWLGLLRFDICGRPPTRLSQASHKARAADGQISAAF